MRTLERFFLSPDLLVDLLVFLAASGALAGALPPVEAGALEAVEAGLGAIWGWGSVNTSNQWAGSPTELTVMDGCEWKRRLGESVVKEQERWSQNRALLLSASPFSMARHRVRAPKLPLAGA